MPALSIDRLLKGAPSSQRLRICLYYSLFKYTEPAKKHWTPIVSASTLFPQSRALFCTSPSPEQILTYLSLSLFTHYRSFRLSSLFISLLAFFYSTFFICFSKRIAFIGVRISLWFHYFRNVCVLLYITYLINTFTKPITNLSLFRMIRCTQRTLMIKHRPIHLLCLTYLYGFVHF